MALRVGGSLQDLVSYDVPGATRSGTEFSECNADFLLNEPDRVGFRGACLRAAAYDQIDSMAREAGAPMIFGISALHGREFPRERNPAVKDAGCEKCTATPCEPCWTGRWNPVAGGARALLDHIYRRAQSNESALAAFSLGNERCAASAMPAGEAPRRLCGIGGIAAHLPPEQVGDDFARFSGVVDQVWGNQRSKTLVMPPAIGLSRPLIVGPDCQLPLDSVQGWYSRFFPNGGAALDAFSYHLYWLGSSATWGRVKRKMLDRDFSASFKDDELSRGDLWPLSRAFFSTINEYDYIAKVGAPQAQIWVSEAGGAYGSGAPNITDRFLSAFWYLDELGEMAKTSTSLHCRQTLVGGRYGLLQWNDGVLVPNPDYFATRLWNELMGERALKAVLVNLAAPGSAPAANSAPALDEQRAGDVRAYAHCRRAGAGAAGDVVVLVINSSSRRARKLKLRQAGVSALARLPRVEFHVQPPADASGNPDVGGFAALLNGVPLDDVEAPLVGLRANGDSDVVVAPLSYAFIAFEGANWPACLEPEAETSSNTYRFPPRAAGARPRRPRPPPPAAAAPAPAKAPKLAKAPPPPPPSPKRGQKRQEKPRDRVKERVRSRRRITKAPNR
ncbi:glycosyl hydrolase family 79, N-terminal domain-containing protein [Pelagophyceae sp. CCMP2097]|nr:glycosyl hydrolase family 79, N-terminal domain-containing protein [Pelagophyceae sp. CCMP2097]